MRNTPVEPESYSSELRDLESGSNLFVFVVSLFVVSQPTSLAFFQARASSNVRTKLHLNYRILSSLPKLLTQFF